MERDVLLSGTVSSTSQAVRIRVTVAVTVTRVCVPLTAAGRAACGSGLCESPKETTKPT